MNKLVSDNLCESLDKWYWDYSVQHDAQQEQQMVSGLDKMFSQRTAELAAEDACYCGQSLSVVDGALYEPGREPAARMEALAQKVRDEISGQQELSQKKRRLMEKIRNYQDPLDVSVVMAHIGSAEVMDCLCKASPDAAAIGGSTSYTGGGKCHSIGVTGFGHWYHGMALSEESKRSCGYYEKLDAYLRNLNNRKALEPMYDADEQRARLIEGDPFMTLRTKGQCRPH